MKISCIVAMSEDLTIGCEGKLPWHLPNDLERFKALTTGHPIIMGRKTYESIGRPLPDRLNIVLSNNPDFTAEGVVTAASLDDAFKHAEGADEVFIIGGEALYRMGLPLADRLYLTLVHDDFEGDVHLPDDVLDGWTMVEDECHEADDTHACPYSFRLYERAA